MILPLHQSNKFRLRPAQSESGQSAEKQNTQI